MQKILIFIILIFFTPNHLFATPYKEIDNIINLNENLTYDLEGTLIIFRLDDTLIRLEQMLGSIEWFQNRKNQLQALSPKKAIKQTLLEWLTIQNLTKCKLIDQNTTSLLQSLQKIGYNILIITERPFYLMQATKSQLASLGINLSSSAYGQQYRIIETPGEEYNNKDFLPIILQKGILFTSGIINNTSFSTALELLFKQENKFPQNIIYIDQDKDYIKDIDLLCEKQMINFTGVRFSAADQEINNFNTKIAEVQLDYLQSFFSADTLQLLVNIN